MPKGMTPKKRKLKTTVSLARSLKPSGRLNVDDIKRAGRTRKEMSLSQIKDTKKLGRAAKMASKVASGMGAMGMNPEKVKNLLKEAKMRKPSGRINMDDLFNADKYKMKKPKRAPMQKGPRPMRPIRGPKRQAPSPQLVIARRRAKVKR